jgi:DNA ligase-associated metallophosphoesterase
MTAAARIASEAHVVAPLAGERVVLTPEGALWWPERSTLIVADLHLEKGSAFARRGMLLPPLDSLATLDHLARLIRRLDPSRVVSLGDAFHDISGPERLPLAARDGLAALMAGREWIWIAGNHDPILCGDLGGLCLDEFPLGRLVFRHEPTRGRSEGECAGHLHPAAVLRLGPAAPRRACFAFDGARMILPAFGAYAGGLSLTNRAFDGLFDPARLVVGVASAGRVHLFPGRLARP